MSINFLEELEKKNNNFDKNIRSAKQISRNTIYRVVLLSSGIIGFSVSFFSIPILQSALNVSRLRFSWYFFLSAIIIGITILFLAGRFRSALTWKTHQLSQWLEKYDDYTKFEKIQARFIALLSLIYPYNLVFNKSYNAEGSKHEQRVNGLVVHFLARGEQGLISILENIFLVCFILGLVFLVFSFKI